MKNPYSSTLNVHASSRSVLSFSSVHRSNTAPVKSGSGTGICHMKSNFFVIAHARWPHSLAHTHARTHTVCLVPLRWPSPNFVGRYSTIREINTGNTNGSACKYVAAADTARKCSINIRIPIQNERGWRKAHDTPFRRCLSAGFHSTENRREQAPNYYDSHNARYVCNVFRIVLFFAVHLYSNIDKHSNLRLHASVCVNRVDASRPHADFYLSHSFVNNWIFALRFVHITITTTITAAIATAKQIGFGGIRSAQLL